MGSEEIWFNVVQFPAKIFLSISSSWVNLRLHTEMQLYTLPGNALKVCVVGGGGV